LSPVGLIKPLFSAVPLAATEPEDEAIANSFEKGTNLVTREQNKLIWRKNKTNRFGKKTEQIDSEKEQSKSVWRRRKEEREIFGEEEKCVETAQKQKVIT
jgi:hypothetical protein